MFDFLVKNASLPDGTESIDIASKNGLITAVEKMAGLWPRLL